MGDVDRLVSSLVASGTALDRVALEKVAAAVGPDVAPLAGAEGIALAIDEIVGLGPLEALVGDPDVTDVLVNGPEEVWFERDGSLQRSDIRFRGDASLIALVRRVITPLGLRIDAASPAVDARLPDGSRLHAVIPPASVDHPVLAIRRFHGSIGTMDDLIARGSITEDQAAVLGRAVVGGSNIVVAGRTGAGKTSLLNVLCAAIPDGERIVTIEDAAELRIPGHVVRLEARTPNVEGAGGISIRDLLRHALRLRPDRIVVGEVRGPEALDMVQAMSTGHAGSMSTIHADAAVQAMDRLETLAAMAPERVPHDALRSLITSAIDLIVVVERVDGLRRVKEITTMAEIRPA